MRSPARPFILSLLAFILPACGVLGSGIPAEQTREVDSFSRVLTSSEVDLEVTHADQTRVVVTCDDNLIDDILTEVDGDTLEVRLPRGMRINPRTDCVATVAAPLVEALVTTGSGEVYADGPFKDLSLVKSTGSGEMEVSVINSPHVEIITTGSGDLELAGRADTVSIRTTGSGEVDARALKAGDLTIVTTGSGEVWGRASGQVDVRSTGSGDVEIYGNPQDVDQRSTGSGDIAIH